MGDTVIGCGGALINDLYVLTAAHCVNNKNLAATLRLSGVRLGEHDTSQNIDCTLDEDGFQFCADEAIHVAVAEAIVHENYTSARQGNDIALLRLTRSVPSTYYVKPICLPINGDELERELTGAGWGRGKASSLGSEVFLQARLPSVDVDECNRVYSNHGMKITDKQVCAGGREGNDSCVVDSGGPLMSRGFSGKYKNRYTVVGVSSFGSKQCGLTGWPAVYTKVSEYVPWIMSKLRP